MYSFEFAAQVTRICMDEIRRRGLNERKILRKSAPNSMLTLKVFRLQHCVPDDLVPVSIHSVATLMQDTLWCCQERIVPKKVWRDINYETCTLPDLSRFISKKGHELLVEILDFLVAVMRHKYKNLMDAYHLGEAMGKVTLGPADCDTIIAEKAGHFMTRMIIEHSKQQYVTRIDSGLSLPTSCRRIVCYRPMSKSEAAKAKAKSYDRLINRIRRRNLDWATYAAGLRAMLDDDYDSEPPTEAVPWISVFSSSLEGIHPDMSPTLYRIMMEVCKPKLRVPLDPFASSSLFAEDESDDFSTVFSEFVPPTPSHHVLEQDQKRSIPHLQKINNSFSNLKLNIRKPKLLPDDVSTHYANTSSVIVGSLPEEDEVDAVIGTVASKPKLSKHRQVRGVMKKVIKFVPKRNATGPTVC